MLCGKIACPLEELNLKITLCGGQSFRWKKLEADSKTTTSEEWIGVVMGCVWILNQEKNILNYKIVGDISKKLSNTPSNVEIYETKLRRYLRLDFKLKEYYSKWRTAHKHFEGMATKFPAIRVLDQEPVENLFSFICSQNNHINRISAMIEKLCCLYGEKICTYCDVDYYTFPDVTVLCSPKVEEKLREEKFGYRSKFIGKAAAEIVAKGGLSWLCGLRDIEYREAKKELVNLTGIGPKVADCICLMSLGHLQAIPVDTHVFQIARNHYLPDLKKSKTVTTKIYEEIGNVFREIYGPYAGWAQTVLFCSELHRFKKENDAPK